MDSKMFNKRELIKNKIKQIVVKNILNRKLKKLLHYVIVK
jgi:hypothetical protein